MPPPRLITFVTLVGQMLIAVEWLHVLLLLLHWAHKYLCCESTALTLSVVPHVLQVVSS